MLTDQKPIDLAGVEGVVVYGDTSVKGQYYYLPTRPSVAIRNGTYQYSLIEYEAPLRDNRAGVLSMVVDLHLDDSALAALTAALRTISPGDPLSLNPIPWTSGGYSASLETGTPIVGVPSLFGTNAALVHLELDLNALNTLRTTLSAGLTPPISIVYKMSFDSFRPAYRCSAKLNEANYLDWVRKECHANLVIVDFQSTETFAMLRKEKVLEISSVDFDPDSDPEFQLSILRSLQYVFQPLPRFGKLPASNDSGWSIGISCSQMEQVQEVSRRADFNMRIAKAVPQAAYVQGVVEGLAQAYEAIPAIPVPSGGDTPFAQEILVTCYADYALDGIDTVALVVRKTDRSLAGSHTFYPDDSKPWKLNLDYIPGSATTYEYRYIVTFSAGKPVAQLPSDWQPLGRWQAFVNLVVRDLYSHRMIEISTAQAFPWNVVTRVEVRTTPPFGHHSSEVTKQIDAGDRSTSFGMFLIPSGGTDTISYTLTVVPKANAGMQIMGPYLANNSIYIDPFEKREVSFAATGVDWSSVTSITIKASLKPDGKPILGNATTFISLTEAAPRANLTYYYTDSSQLQIGYRYSIRHSDNTKTEGGDTSSDVFINIPPESTSHTV